MSHSAPSLAPGLIVTIILVSALAFGAVYPWALWPLLGMSALIGLRGLMVGRGIPDGSGPLLAALAIVALASAVQLVPLPATLQRTLSPHAAEIQQLYQLGTLNPSTWRVLTLDGRGTSLAVACLVGFGLYMVGCSGLLTGRNIRRLPSYLTLVAVPLALFGIISRERGNGFVYGFWRSQEGGVDVFGPFINRNHFAGWMLMATLFVLGHWIGLVEHASKRQADQGPTSGRRQLLWFGSTEGSRIILTGVAILVMATSLVWTLSRSAMIGLVAALAVLSYLVAHRRAGGDLKRWPALVALAAVVLTALTVRGLDRVTNWFADTRDIYGRFGAWADGWRVVHDFPLVGAGLNTYGIAMLFYQRSNPGFHLGSAHNDYLQVMAEGGLLVGIPTIVAIACLALAVRRSLCAAGGESRGYWIRAGAAVALVGIAVQEVAEFSLQVPANAFLFCTLAATALAPIETPVTRGADRVSIDRADRGFPHQGI